MTGNRLRLNPLNLIEFILTKGSFPSPKSAGHGIKLEVGLVLAIEPMINLGTWQVKTLDDGWTCVTTDGKPSAHYENTVALTEHGTEILTL